MVPGFAEIFNFSDKERTFEVWVVFSNIDHNTGIYFIGYFKSVAIEKIRPGRKNYDNLAVYYSGHGFWYFNFWWPNK